MRVAVRLSAESTRRKSFGERRTRAFIYGAGDAGAALLRDIRQNHALNYDVCGFIDDNPKKLGLVLHGVKVVASGNTIEDAAKKYAVELGPDRDSVRLGQPDEGDPREMHCAEEFARRRFRVWRN